MFKIAESEFDAPSPVIAFFNVFLIKRTGQVCDDVFAGIFNIGVTPLARPIAYSF